jgi:hypothetical protein
VKAGPENCALHEPTPSQVFSRLHALLANLRQNPIAVPTSDGLPALSYGLVDYKLVKNALFQYLYQPYGSRVSDHVLGASSLASALHALELGDGRAMWSRYALKRERFKNQRPLPGLPLPPGPRISTPDASSVLICLDPSPMNISVADVKWYFDANAEDSEFADVWPILALCACVSQVLAVLITNAGFSLFVAAGS